MSFEQVNDSLYPGDAAEQPDASNRPGETGNDWAGDPLEGSGFEAESPEPSFEWRE